MTEASGGPPSARVTATMRRAHGWSAPTKPAASVSSSVSLPWSTSARGSFIGAPTSALPGRDLPADALLDDVGDAGEVLPAPAAVHGGVVGTLGLLEERRGDLRGARLIERQARVL